MQLTTQTDYALRMLLYLALAPDRTASTSAIADAYGISLHHLRKVAQRLAGLGHVQTTRGRAGGLRLISPPETVQLGDIVVAFEPDMALVECLSPRQGRCVITADCTLKRPLLEARRAFIAALNRYTIAALIAGPARAQLVRALGLSPRPASAR